jgi:Thioredoxin domain-containing protein
MHGNLNGNRPRSAVSSVDFYRRVPRDLTEATTLGAFMSLCAIVLMGLLFFAETIAFARSNIVTEIALDDNTDPQIQLNFNVTLFALHCDYVSVDVWDVLGTNKQNVTKNIEKWQVNEAGNRVSFSGRNRETRELEYETHVESLEELHANGVHVTSIESKEHFEEFLKQHEMAFVNFFAPWCMWCQRLHPTWEKFAELVDEEEMPVGIASVDCVTHVDICREQVIQAFPTLRWYEEGTFQAPPYKNDRTVAAFSSFTKRKLELNSKFKDWSQHQKGKTKEEYRQLYNVAENPGCQVSGTLMGEYYSWNFAEFVVSLFGPFCSCVYLRVHAADYFFFVSLNEYIY